MTHAQRIIALAITCIAILGSSKASADTGTYKLRYVDEWYSWVDGRKLPSCGARAAEIARKETLKVEYDGVALIVDGERWTVAPATSTKKVIVATWPRSPKGLHTSLHLDRGSAATAHVTAYRLGEFGKMTCSDVGAYAVRFKKK